MAVSIGSAARRSTAILFIPSGRHVHASDRQPLHDPAIGPRDDSVTRWRITLHDHVVPTIGPPDGVRASIQLDLSGGADFVPQGNRCEVGIHARFSEQRALARALVAAAGLVQFRMNL